MDVALRAKTREQTLGNPLFEMEVDGILGEYARVLKDDRADRCLAAPLSELLVLLAGHAERVEGRGPTRVGCRAAVERGKIPETAPFVIRCLGERLGAE